MKRVWIAVSLGIWLAGVAVAEEPAVRRPAGELRGPGFLVPPAVLADLKLTDEQEVKYKDLLANFEKDRAALPSMGREGMADFHDQMKAAEEAKDEAKIAELRKKREDMIKPMMELRQKYMEQFRALLTAEQQMRLDAALKDVRERHGEGPGHRPNETPKQ